ncbi:BON domain-containing protein [Singulisphaera sp. GP187]|uniref:BON domain-containing protein n=1 Tax=Singulisphaera sp. GP187 TaxID=1882752 RepID=UPI00092C1762|nr:BON domain-containing protein [Singulisphaera sp. GP187]SIN68528.1 BON domain-containing protein [Singulisphaera sp. GP187]
MLERLTGLGLGVGLMYFFDPRAGRRRRALLRDQCIHGMHEAETTIQIVWHDLRTRALRLTAESKAMFSDDYAPDDVIEARVRSALGHVVSHPRSVRVVVRDGQVVLSGPILAREVESLMETVDAVRGVLAVENQMEIHQQAEGLPALQGGTPRPEIHHGMTEESGSPTTKALIALAGGLLIARAIKRNRLTSLALGTLCVGLAVRGLAKASAEAQCLHDDKRNSLPRGSSGVASPPGIMITTRVGP